MKKLPIGIQTFSEIINSNYLYIDKTKYIFELCENYKYAFLSRPRRFGKSLLISTMKELFCGNKELFQGLDIYDKWDWDVEYPVIEVRFDGVLSSSDLQDKLNKTLLEVLKKYGIEYELGNQSADFYEIIKLLASKYNQKVVILIDEYDKAILDNISKPEEAKTCREILRVFYSQIKGADQYVKFAFLTGVSKFTKTSLFSGLNNIFDISLKPKFAEICGYTQHNIENEFQEYLEGVDKEKLKLWYNGYNFLGERVYNPFDILLFIEGEFEFKNYWFETGTPNYLMELIKNENYFFPYLESKRFNDKLLNSFDIERISLVATLFQAGYLTVDKVIKVEDLNAYKLKFPNKEVKLSFNNFILSYLLKEEESEDLKFDIVESFLKNDLNEIGNCLKRVFSSLSYHTFTNNNIANYEGFYSNIIFVFLSSLGFQTIQEDTTNRGRIDLTLIHEDSTFIFEFKITDDDPLKQIKEKKYYEKYSGDVYIVGINFDVEQKNISKFVWEKI